MWGGGPEEMKRQLIRLNPATQSGEQRPALLPAGQRIASFQVGSWLALLLFFGSLVVAGSRQGLAQRHNPPPQHGGQPAAQPAPPPQRQPQRAEQRPPVQPKAHLGDWLQTHQNLAPAEQEKALQREPGFNKLPGDQQRRLENRLRDLNNKSPQQRQRTIDRVEVWERLSPEQKRQVRDSTVQLRSLPPDRQIPIRKAFRDLRDVPPGQRQTILNSPRFQSQFTPQERGVLSNLLTVEPYPPIRPAPAESPAPSVPIPAYR